MNHKAKMSRKMRIAAFFIRHGFKKTFKINGKLYPLENLKVENGEITFTINLE
jgi:hypothetical protein